MRIVEIDVCAIEIGNTVSSLIRNPKLQYQVSILQRCLCYRGNKYRKLFNRDAKKDSTNCAHSKICLCCRDRKYSELFNTDSKGTVSSVRITHMSML